MNYVELHCYFYCSYCDKLEKALQLINIFSWKILQQKKIKMYFIIKGSLIVFVVVYRRKFFWVL